MLLKNCSKYLIIFIGFLLLPGGLSAQHWTTKFTWWNQKHNWDGQTPWHEYITLSAGFMGPNSLPVPRQQEGNIHKHITLEHTNNYYFHPGDETVDLNLKFIYPILDKVQLEAWMVPVEYFHISDTLIRDERAIRYKNPEGTAVGDLYMGTHVKVLDQPDLPQIVLGFCFRTASGSDLSMARYTDTPGYYFDLSFGHSFKFKKQNLKEIRIYGMTGFYAYQTYDLLHNQNDAVMYGLGFNLKTSKWTLKNKLSGYYGYLDIGDQPAIYRMELIYRKKYMHWFVRYQNGLNDFPYQSIGIGSRWELKKNANARK